MQNKLKLDIYEPQNSEGDIRWNIVIQCLFHAYFFLQLLTSLSEKSTLVG